MENALTAILPNENHVASTQHHKTLHLSGDRHIGHVTDASKLQQRLDQGVKSLPGQTILQTLCRIEVCALWRDNMLLKKTPFL